jgi:glyoxylate reductase
VNAMPSFAAPLLEGRIEHLPWELALHGTKEPVDGMFIFGHPPVDGPMLDRLPGLKIISNHGVGVDHIDLHAAAARGIPVGNTPAVLDGAVADLAFALMLAAARKVVEGDRYARSPEFTVFDPSYMLGRDVCGSTLGIVGLGSIGMQIAQRARGFDMRVVYHNRRQRSLAVEHAAEATYLSLDELLGQSDFVVLIVPLTDETRGLIGKRELSLMKPTATLINVARGPVVDTDALTEVLTNKQIYAAALDVTEPEPLPRNHPLLKLENLTVLPHLGSATVQTRKRMAELAVENLLLGLRGEPLRCEIKPA